MFGRLGLRHRSLPPSNQQHTRDSRVKFGSHRARPTWLPQFAPAASVIAAYAGHARPEQVLCERGGRERPPAAGEVTAAASASLCGGRPLVSDGAAAWVAPIGFDIWGHARAGQREQWHSRQRARLSCFSVVSRSVSPPLFSFARSSLRWISIASMCVCVCVLRCRRPYRGR